jgi:membrane protein YqaA with SNARE-associated domain
MDGFITQIISIYLAGITGLYKGVPVGFALQASPYITALFTALGSLTTVFVLYFSGSPLRSWILNKYGKKKIEKSKSRFTTIMEKYGVVGLGVLATGLIGPIITLLIGLMLIKDMRRLMLFLSIGILLWSAALTVIASFSLELLKPLF